jgi:hypothetical protein
MRSVVAAMIASFWFFGCGSSEDSAEPEPMPDPNLITIESGTYHLEPGDEKYLCYTANLPDRDLSIYEIVPKYGKGVHHTVFSWTLVPETEPEFECPVLFKMTWIPLYAGGVGSNPLKMPEGAGVKLTKNRQLLLQLHLQNTGSQPIDDKTTIEVYAEDDRPDIVGAGVYGIDNRKIDIAPNAEGVTTTLDCQTDKEMNVFATLPHMHKLGSHIQLERTAPTPSPLFSEQWAFDDQPILPLTTTLSAGDQLRLTCTHDNPFPKPVTWGESSDEEMCIAILYYTPYEQLNGCLGQ